MTPGKRNADIQKQIELTKNNYMGRRDETITDDLQPTAVKSGPQQMQSGKKSLENQFQKIKNDSESIHDSFEMESHRNAQTPVNPQGQPFPSVSRFHDKQKKSAELDQLNDTLDLSTHHNKQKDGDNDEKKNINTSMLQKLSNEDDHYSIASEVLDKDVDDELPR